MTTWQELSSQLMTYHPHARVFQHGMRFVLDFDGTRVGCSVRAFDDTSIVALVELGAANALDPFELLGLNAMVGQEALAMIDGVLVVRSVIANDTPIVEIERRIHSAAQIGAFVKVGIKRPCDSILFAHYAH